MSTSIHAIILAAGASKRMPNHIKQLLPWKDSTLLGNAIEQAQTLVDYVHVILGAHANKIQPTLPSQVRSYLNPDWELGMGSSIAFGISQALKSKDTPEAVLVMVPDQPLIDSNHLNSLKEAYLSSKNICVVATDYGNARSGVPALLGNELFPKLQALNADIGAKQIIKENMDNALFISGNGKEIDVDTYESYLQLIDKNNLTNENR